VDELTLRGPTRDDREKPDLAASGVGINATKSGSATFDEVEARTGTSMAAPHVSGAVALLLSHGGKQQGKKAVWEQLNAAQIRAAISQSAQSFDLGPWNQRMGFGVLDVKALLDAFP
jgi:subtilisin family serine protease